MFADFVPTWTAGLLVMTSRAQSGCLVTARLASASQICLELDGRLVAPGFLYLRFASWINDVICSQLEQLEVCSVACPSGAPQSARRFTGNGYHNRIFSKLYDSTIPNVVQSDLSIRPPASLMFADASLLWNVPLLFRMGYILDFLMVKYHYFMCVNNVSSTSP